VTKLFATFLVTIILASAKLVWLPSFAAAHGPEATSLLKLTDKAIGRGIDFLLASQNRNGSWGSARRTKGLNIAASVPGSHLAFRAAVTSLCISAMIESGDNRNEVNRATDRAEKWLMERLPKLRRATPTLIYNVWSHAYSIQALVRMYDRISSDQKRREKIKELVRQQVVMLTRYECVDGGWSYYDFKAKTQKPSGSTISFVTATVLIALHDAKRIGVEAPDKLIQRAMASIRRQRKPDFSYCYGEYLKYVPMNSVNRPGGSLGRSQVCNLAMYLWGDQRTTTKVMSEWLDRLVKRNGWLSIGRKRPQPHESWFAVAGYFYYYGHYYASLCLEQLEPLKRHEYGSKLAEILVDLQEKDGSWWDFPMYDYHQPYGTAFAIMSLVRLRKAGR